MDAQQLDLFEQLNQEYSPNIGKLITDKVKRLAQKKAELQTAEDLVLELTKQVKLIEEEELPNLMDELQLTTFEHADGTKVKLTEQLIAGVRKECMDAAFKFLQSQGCDHILKPKVTLVIDDRVDISALIADIKKLVRAHVESSYQYHYQTLAAMLRKLVMDGIKLDPNIFSQSVKRSVKVTVPKNLPFSTKF